MNSQNILIFYQQQFNNNVWNDDTKRLFNLLKTNKPKTCVACNTEKLGTDFYEYKRKCKECFKTQYKLKHSQK